MKTQEEDDLEAMLDSTLEDFLKTVDEQPTPTTTTSNNNNSTSTNSYQPLDMDAELAETLKRLSESAEKLNVGCISFFLIIIILRILKQMVALRT